MHFAPTTELGRRSAWLALTAVVLQFLWRILPGGALASFVVAIVAGAGALVAIAGKDERSVAAYLSTVPLAGVVVFLVAELASTA